MIQTQLKEEEDDEMGNLICVQNLKHQKQQQASANRSIEKASKGTHSSDHSTTMSIGNSSSGVSKLSAKAKYGFIDDNFSTLNQVLSSSFFWVFFC